MIVVRLAQGAWQHAGVRATEWIGAWPLFAMGAVLWHDFDVFGISPSFAVIGQWATEAQWAAELLVVANMRLIALFVNGYFDAFRYSPLIRFVASCAAGLSWSVFASGFFISWLENGGAPTAWVAYSTLVLLELRNAYVSRRDMAVTRRAANVRTER